MSRSDRRHYRRTYCHYDIYSILNNWCICINISCNSNSDSDSDSDKNSNRNSDSDSDSDSDSNSRDNGQNLLALPSADSYLHLTPGNREIER